MARGEDTGSHPNRQVGKLPHDARTAFGGRVSTFGFGPPVAQDRNGPATSLVDVLGPGDADRYSRVMLHPANERSTNPHDLKMGAVAVQDKPYVKHGVEYGSALDDVKRVYKDARKSGKTPKEARLHAVGKVAEAGVKASPLAPRDSELEHNADYARRAPVRLLQGSQGQSLSGMRASSTDEIKFYQ